MKAHLMFEQSGTFKNEFKKLGYEAYDYDILNDYGETDYQIDLFSEIEKAYGGVFQFLTISLQTTLFLRSFHVHFLPHLFCLHSGGNHTEWRSGITQEKWKIA